MIYRLGIDGLSYEILAKKTGLVRAGVYKYFPDISDLLLFVSGIIRVEFQEMVVAEMKTAKSPTELISKYILTSLDWTDRRPKHAVIWLLFYHKCCIDEELSSFNRSLVNVGTQRIESILKHGLSVGEFKMAAESIPQVARHTQLIITGGLVSRPTENRNPQAWSDEKKLILNIIRSQLGLPPVEL